MATDSGEGGDGSVENRVAALLDRMTLREKVGQMVGIPPDEDLDAVKDVIREYAIGSSHFGGTPYNTPREKAQYANAVQRVAIEETRLGVPLFLRAMAEHGHAAISGSTVFPQQLGLAATRNPDRLAAAAGVAATEMNATGVHATSSPIGDVARDARWGRIAETFGESPYLNARMVEAMVEGYQGDDLAAQDAVLAVTKHFPAYSEGLRGEDAAPNEITQYTLRRVHVPPYAAGIDAGTGGIMPCYNSINGEPVHGSKRFLSDLLRDDLGFEGFVLADYAGAEDLHRGHDTSASLEESLWQSIRAGMDLLPSGGAEYARIIHDLVEDSELPESRIEESARRILRAKARLGLFEDPYVDVDAAERTLGSEPHREVARETARESMTLLQNEGDVLPLPSDLDSILVAGPNADALAHQHGGWGSVDDPEPLGDTLLEGVEAAVGDGTDIAFEQGTTINERLDVDAAAAAATEADAAVVALGEPDYVHEFGSSSSEFEPAAFPSRLELALPEAQVALAEAVSATGTPTVAVMITGRMLAIDDVVEAVPAVLMAYQPGSEGGTAMADVLFGEYNPGGALPMSIPRSAAHLPTRFNYLPHPRHHGDPEGSHPPSYDPLFEYGHGLSYTEFECGALSLSATEVGPAGTVEVEVPVENVGQRAGEEVVECFITDQLSSRVTPVRELCGFERLRLDAGERGTVTFELDVRAMGVVQDDGERVVEPGAFTVRVGDRSAEFEVRPARY